MRALGRLQIEHREEADRCERGDDGDDCLTGDLVSHGIAGLSPGCSVTLTLAKKKTVTPTNRKMIRFMSEVFGCEGPYRFQNGINHGI